MRLRPAAAIACSLVIMLGTPAFAAVIYDNLTPNDLMAMATRPDTGGGTFEIEGADDFLLGTHSVINSASFVGLLVPGASGDSPSISEVVVEIYRVFPNDSDATRTPNVPTRANSPSDVAFDSRDSESDLAFTTTTLNATFTAANSVQPGGIHPSPDQTTGGNGGVTGQEVRIDVTFTTPFDLPPDHYFFVPQVALTNGGQFYWLSASRPIAGPGTTPFAPDLQTWTRDAHLDPDWLRVGTDIVGGASPPTFNAAFALNGTAVPEPATLLLVGIALAVVAARVRQRRRAVA
jgi:hypothetical protein